MKNGHRMVCQFVENSPVEMLLSLLLLSCSSCPSRSLRPHALVAHQAPLSMGFPRQEYWSGLPFPSPGDLPNPGSKLIFGIDRQIVFHWATREAVLRFMWPPQTPSIVSGTEYCKGPVFSSKRLLSKHVLLTLCVSWEHSQGMCRAESFSGDLGLRSFPGLFQLTAEFIPCPPGTSAPVSIQIVSGGQSFLLEATTFLPLLSCDSPPKASFELCTQNTDPWLGHSHYLNHFLSLSFLLNHRYLMTACKLNMCMLWDYYAEKNNLEVLDSFIASYRSSPKQSGIKHGLSFPIIGYSTSK